MCLRRCFPVPCFVLKKWLRQYLPALSPHQRSWCTRHSRHSRRVWVWSTPFGPCGRPLFASSRKSRHVGLTFFLDSTVIAPSVSPTSNYVNPLVAYAVTQTVLFPPVRMMSLALNMLCCWCSDWDASKGLFYAYFDIRFFAGPLNQWFCF